MSRHIIQLKYASVLMCALVCSGESALAASNRIELRWGELAPVIVNHKVKVVLPGGTEIQGLAVAVRDDALVLNVKKTSDRKGYPTGQNVIPRASLSTLQIDDFRGAGGRTIGVIVGALGGLILGGDLVAHTTNTEAAAISSFLGISTGSAIAGYYAGRARDHNVTMIKIVPEK
jgi:hypothetical protein